MSKKEGLRKTYATFTATGRVKFNKNDGFQINQHSKNKPDYVYSRMTLHIDCGKERLSFAQLIGGYDTNNPLPIRAFGKNEDGTTNFNVQYEIEWENRKDPKVLEQVSDLNLITVGLAEGINSRGVKSLIFEKFLSPYDAINYIYENIKEDSIVRVHGTLDFSEINGRVIINKNVKSIYLVDTPEDKFGATFRIQLLLDEHSLGQKQDNGLYPLQGYVVNYDKDVKQNIALPLTIYIDPTRYKNWASVVKYLKPTKKDQILVWGIQGSFKIITETVEITLNDLSHDLRQLVELGMITEQDALTRAISSNRSEEIMLFESFATRKSEDGIDVFDLDGNLYTIDDIIFKEQLLSKEKTKSTPTNKGNKETKTTGTLFAEIDDDLSLDLDDILAKF